MPTKRNTASTTRYWPNYRQMALEGLKLAKRAESEFERERYVLATAFFVKRALEIESMRSGGTTRSPVEVILSEQTAR